MGKAQPLYDLIVVGATPAGLAAAVRGRQLELRTLVLDIAPPAADGHLDWLGPAGVTLCEACGLKGRAFPGLRFTGLRLHSGNFKRRSQVDSAALTGWVVERAKLAQALGVQARRQGAEVSQSAPPGDVVLGEEQAVVHLPDGRAPAGRILLIADDPVSPVATLARLPAVGSVESGVWEAQLDWPGPVEETGLDVVFAGRHAAQLITILRARGHIQVGLLTREAQPPADQQLTEILHAAAAAELIPPAPPAVPRCRLASAGVALDLETHVGKRCLLVGEAGGFVSAFSQERLYPAMKSGWLAAETAARALRANLPQDELSSFSAAWRTELADYLRLPNTNLGLLMPLVFDNAQMSERVARAFLLGQSF